MISSLRPASLALVAGLLAGPVAAAPCSDTGANYESWKPQMAQEAAAVGVGQRGIAALMGVGTERV